MKVGFLHKLLLGGIVLISSAMYAQENNLNEENNLKFQTYFFEALKQKAIRNYSKAITSLEKCYELDSTSLAVEFEFSKNYLLLNKYNESQLFIDKALKKKPENIYLLRHKIAIYRSLRNFQSAIEIQKKLVQIQPHYSDELVLLYIQNKNFKKAEELLHEIEKNGLKTTRIRGFKKFLENRKTSPKKGNETQAAFVDVDIITLKKRFSENKDFRILQEILSIELSKNQFELLNIDSKEGLELFPAQPFLYKMNGIALNKLGKYNEAISVLTIGIDFVVENRNLEADFYEELSISYGGLGNKKEALKYKQKAEQIRNKT